MKKILVVFMTMICLILIGAAVFLKITEDDIPPEIHIQENSLVYSDGMDQAQLLQGVTATDNRDGDVTESLVIEKIYEGNGEGTVTIVYAARDSKNNVAKVKRVVPTVASDTEEKVTEQTSVDERPTEDGIVENSGNITTDVSATVQEQEDKQEEHPEGSPVITLKEQKITVTAGTSVNQLSYVDTITDDLDSKEDLWRNIQITGDELNTDLPGTYELRYYVVDSDGNKSNEAILTVIVK